ncbi:MAG: hypothetical protein JKY56_08965 [Kofleriaceae bacterium]|nr:hypothetical protein [Kofleriaceae bacterium]
MQSRNLLIGALGLISVVVMFKVMMDSSGDDGGEIDSSAVEDAIKDYDRRHKESAETVVASKPSIVSPTKVRSVLPKDESETKPTAKLQPRVMPSLPATDSIYQKSLKSSGLRTEMADANKLYDQADYEGAREAALTILNGQSENVRMLRIVVSSSCIMGDEDIAVKYYQGLPKRDQAQMQRRCKRYDIAFDE